MDILQLCVFTNLWNKEHRVNSIDLKNGKDIFNVTLQECNNYDLVCAAPPCDQFTKANAMRWEQNPEQFIRIAERCFQLCRQTKKYWFLENPPGRIEKFIPELTKYRLITWQDPYTNKEYVIYGNFIIMQTKTERRYGKQTIKRPKTTREAWRPELIKDIQKSLKYGNNYILQPM